MSLYPEAVGWDREDIDVLDFPALRAKIDGLGFVPGAVINWRGVQRRDGAEDRPEQAFALNGDFPGRLARYTGERGIPLVHYSTNYVFDGTKGEYTEDEVPAPLSVYGASKQRGERFVLKSGGPCYIVRTAVIFGPKGASNLPKRASWTSCWTCRQRRTPSRWCATR